MQCLSTMPGDNLSPFLLIFDYLTFFIPFTVEFIHFWHVTIPILYSTIPIVDNLSTRYKAALQAYSSVFYNEIRS